MNQHETLYGVAFGACTSVGPNLLESSLGLRAGLSGIRETALLDRAGEPVVAGMVPTLSPFVLGNQRFGALLDQALNDLDAQVGTRMGGLRLRVVLLLADDTELAPGTPPDLAPWVREQLALRYGQRLAVETVSLGAVGFASAMPELTASVATSGMDGVLFLGLHTDLERECVMSLEGADRLYRADHVTGVLLGEGACAALFLTARTARDLRFGLAVNVWASELRREAATPFNDDDAYSARALTVAVHQVLASSVGPVGWIDSDLGFEPYRAKELHAVLTRVQHKLGPPQTLDFPQQRLGRLGAALPLFQLGCAWIAWQRGYGPSSQILALQGTDRGVRSALLVQAVLLSAGSNP